MSTQSGTKRRRSARLAPEAELDDDGSDSSGGSDGSDDDDGEAASSSTSSSSSSSAAAASDALPLYERIRLKNIARNEQMAAKIDTLLDQDKTYFVVVGTGHLVGDKSIGELLKTTHGYTLEKVAAEGRPSGEEAAAQREADKRLSTPEQAAELRADIQTRLDTKAYAEAVTMATMGAHQLTALDKEYKHPCPYLRLGPKSGC